MNDPRDDSDGRGSENSFKAFRLAGPMFGAGIQMAAAVVVMFFLGRWLDAKFGTGPWLMTIGALIGSGGGLYSFIKTALNVSRTDSEKQSSKNKE